ncbi:UNKNOWN [Stylonychia lemnae]|uniref:Uncharacterized protein n=1 Tax=Stylonychia lemnae TaxID=5949 RepID=A0A078B1U8_STYLE|nr:UNKNOWN [Stylonychia lemnae]|eukprot:CDW87277.1 UNKNOWN [Stylonychia lemnae]
MNCHLQISGKRPHYCDSMNASQCISTLENELWNSYTLFFTHAQQTCYYLKQEVWQDNTKSLIDNLNQASITADLHILNGQESMSQNIVRTFALTEETNNQVEKQLALQKSLQDGFGVLETSIYENQSKLNQFFQSVGEKIELIIQFQSMIVKYFRDMDRFVYYSAKVIIIWILTQFKRFLEAKQRLLFLCACQLIIERVSDEYIDEHHRLSYQKYYRIVGVVVFFIQIRNISKHPSGFQDTNSKYLLLQKIQKLKDQTSRNIYRKAPSYLMPAKFTLILIQVLLLALVIQQSTDHIYWGIGFNYSDTSDEYMTAEKILVGVTIAYLFCMGFEFLVMVLGISLLFNNINIVQIFLHFLGCLFTTWFILDNWRFTYIWPLWGFFGLFPFLLECIILQGAVRMNKDINNNSKGIVKQ